MRNIKKIVLALMLALGLNSVALANENTPEGVILAFYQACMKNDIKKAVSYCTFERRTKSVTERESRNIAHGLKNGADPSKWVFKIEPAPGNRPNKYRVYRKNSTHKEKVYQEFSYASTDRFTVKKIDGIWKIVQF